MINLKKSVETPTGAPRETQIWKVSSVFLTETPNSSEEGNDNF